MKKIFIISIFIFTAIIAINQVTANVLSFPNAIKTCEKYYKSADVEKNNEIFNITISLDKGKNNQCVYKEKISQGKDWELLTCNFEQVQLKFMSESMTKFNEVFAKQIAKEPIFEAKMTTNGEIFQKYLANPKYCTITHSKS